MEENIFGISLYNHQLALEHRQICRKEMNFLAFIALDFIAFESGKISPPPKRIDK